MKGKRMFVSLTKNYMVDRNLIIGLVLIVLFVPLFPASEFYPWRLFDDRNFDITLKFLSSFYPPKVDVEFLSIIFPRIRMVKLTPLPLRRFPTLVISISVLDHILMLKYS